MCSVKKKIINRVQKNRRIFYLLPTLTTILYEKGYVITLNWGFYCFALIDTEPDSIIGTRRS